MIKVVIFDADGVLIHQGRFSKSLDEEYGITIETTASFFKGPFQDCLVGKKDLREAIAPYLDSWGWDKGVDVLLDYWFTIEHAINEDLISYIQELRSKGILCFLATNNEKYRFQYMLEKMGFSESFDRTYSSAHLGEKKPNQEFFAKIYNDLENIQKEEIFFTDDDLENIQGAKDFGIKAEIYTTLARLKEILHEENN